MQTSHVSAGLASRFPEADRLASFIAAAVVLCGAVVLLGWYFNVETIKRLSPHFPSMNPMTACALIAAGLSLALQYRAPGRGDRQIAFLHNRLGAKFLALAVSAYGLLILGEHYLGWTAGVDQLLFTEKLADPVDATTSHTAPGTALCLIFMGLALVCLDSTSRRGARPAEFLAIAGIYTALFGIERYLYAVTQGFSPDIFSAMALHTALACTLLSIGILLARPHVGIMSLSTSVYPGAIILVLGYPLIAVTELTTNFLRFEGTARGYFSETMGAALLTPLNIFIIGMLLIWSARQMYLSEVRRQKTEDERNKFFNICLDPMCIATLDGHFQQVNLAFLTTLGYSEEELLSRPFLDLVHPEDVQATLGAMDRLSHGQDVTRFRNRYRCKDGSWSTLSWVSSSIPSEGKIYASARDISELLEAQAALNAREEELSITLQSIGDGVLSTDTNGYITRLNAMGEKLTGWKEADAIGKPVASVFTILNENTRQAAEIPVAKTLITGSIRELANHTLLVCRDGEERPISDSCAPIHNREGDIVGSVLTFRDVSKERRAAQELRAAHKHSKSESDRLKMVLDTVVDGVIGFNAEGIVQSFNSAAERLYGYSADEVIGRNIQLLAAKSFQEEFDDYLYNHTRTLPYTVSSIDRIVLGLRKDGSTFPLEISIVETASSGEWRFTGVMRDISERTRFIEDLKNAREQADAANKAKSTFLAAMSHEIRTPINGVIGMLDVLHRTSLKGYQVEMIELIQDSADSLLNIINEILDLSKIEAGKMEIHLAPFDLATSVENICVIMDRFAEKLHVELTMFVDPATPPQIVGDSQHLRQILINLISNAVKFCSKRPDQQGHVTVRSQCKESRPGELSIEFQVRDNGIGMDAKTQKQLFKPFEQGEASIGQQFGGTGLGLSISNSLAQLMGGEITVESQPGIGSTFTARLPFRVESGTAPKEDDALKLTDLCCLVIGPPDGLAPDLAAYLSYGGATVERIDSLDQVSLWSRTNRSGKWIWVVDAGDEHPSVADLQATHSTAPDLDVSFLAVVIERGKRHNLRRKGPGVFMVDGNALRRKTLLQAVAVAAGRLPLEQMSVDPSDKDHRNKNMPVSRDEAIECGRLILVAEDNVTNQKVIQKQLALIGVAADITSNGLEAIELWREGRYPLLLTDLHMPGMDGYELTAAIRAEENGSVHTGIVALTANALSGEAEHCLLQGMDDYLSKPAKLGDIESVVNKWLPPVPSTEEPHTTIEPAVAKTATPSREDEPAVDVEVLKALVGDDPNVVREFLEDFRRSSASINKELQAAWKSAELEAVGAAAHKLKSSARTVGAAELGDQCEQLEVAVNDGRFEDVGELLLLFEQALVRVDDYLESCRNTGNYD